MKVRNAEMNLPNKLTILRIIAVPFFIAAYYLQWHLVAFIIFILASLTDMLDGKIARKYNLVTNFGKVMDPLADKVLVYAALIICLDWDQFGKLGVVVVVILLAREFLISGFRLIAANAGVVIAAGNIGKLKTVFQLVGTSLIFLGNPIASRFNIPLGQILVYISTLLSIWSCFEYIYKNKELLRG